ncbi:hypothetical protein ES702_03810 [subsurface metagenome]
MQSVQILLAISEIFIQIFLSRPFFIKLEVRKWITKHLKNVID